jgi:osmotically-inducible protein OsmY
MRHLAKLLLVTAILVCLLQSSVLAQDASTLKQGTVARAATIASLLSAGIVREDQSGFLVIIATQVSDQQRQVVTDENRDRSAIFRFIASQSGETAGQVAGLYAQRAQKLNPVVKQVQPPPPPPVAPTSPESCSDRQIAVNLQDRFARDEDIKKEAIQVDVVNKTVVLSGTVSSALARNYAVDMVNKNGCLVASVVNNLKIDSDKMIASRIQQSFTKEPTLRAQHIQVDVSHGNVVLSGSVPENLIRTVAASTADQIRGVSTVTNNIRVQANAPSAPEPDLPPNHGSLPKANLTGTWVGSYESCAQGRTDISMRITESAPSDITVSAEIAMPNGSPGIFTSHGILNTLNSFLSLQFGGWQHQPPGLSVGDIGGYVTYVNQRPAEFSGIIRPPGCGQISLKKK